MAKMQETIFFSKPVDISAVANALNLQKGGNGEPEGLLFDLNGRLMAICLPPNNRLDFQEGYAAGVEIYNPVFLSGAQALA
ncbi:MAG: hypothetical protein A2729_02130 [Candidatus Buchananbacteria bacterium RIFCSPHIGHO2_01_FULL_39_14]|uniref:Uncharacterized protein n=1 Tax=Candidatus Buchananbacteria bacterium RIFCSPHIGHO2_01_FULL_39_14 TaxID=1797532 RepID=A0A1G1XWJ1_9BACT|nr:MAG: hypothetical protein A2729_02130 [Candidatus Buchananbacteria bacterium RIFCSPHIGHO2_01_FULL_39_14]OGY48207.1 MAG: hypothetical protein A3D39_03735 [Candidatus Buchananbacteria bacterium RIFCSPHIGHO2_02_FULL_39_17]